MSFHDAWNPIKLNTPISFPLEGLSLNPFLGAGVEVNPYDLVGVIMHGGETINSGHYFSFAKWQGNWFYYNDLEEQLVDDMTRSEQVGATLANDRQSASLKKTAILSAIGKSSDFPWGDIKNILSAPLASFSYRVPAYYGITPTNEGLIEWVERFAESLKEDKLKAKAYVPNAARAGATLGLPHSAAAYVPLATIEKIAAQQTPNGHDLADRAHLEGFPYLLVYEQRPVAGGVGARAYGEEEEGKEPDPDDDEADREVEAEGEALTGKLETLQEKLAALQGAVVNLTGQLTVIQENLQQLHGNLNSLNKEITKPK